MANNHEQFVAFHDAIKANDSRIEKLKGNRKALRDRIKQSRRRDSTQVL